MREAAKPEEKQALKKTRFTLQRAPWKLDARRKLAELEADNRKAILITGTLAPALRVGKDAREQPSGRGAIILIHS